MADFPADSYLMGSRLHGPFAKCAMNAVKTLYEIVLARYGEGADPTKRIPPAVWEEVCRPQQRRSQPEATASDSHEDNTDEPPAQRHK